MSQSELIGQIAQLYKEYNTFLDNPEILELLGRTIDILRTVKYNGGIVYCIGNGGSNCLSGHLAEDLVKVCGIRASAFTDSGVITCFSNDYSYEDAIANWLKIMKGKNDILVAISSSGNSPNILKACGVFSEVYAASNSPIITFSSLVKDNQLSQLGTINFYIPSSPIDVVRSTSYGIAENYHGILCHIIIDVLSKEFQCES